MEVFNVHKYLLFGKGKVTMRTVITTGLVVHSSVFQARCLLIAQIDSHKPADFTDLSSKGSCLVNK